MGIGTNMNRLHGRTPLTQLRGGTFTASTADRQFVWSVTANPKIHPLACIQTALRVRMHTGHRDFRMGRDSARRCTRPVGIGGRDARGGLLEESSAVDRGHRGDCSQ